MGADVFVTGHCGPRAFRRLKAVGAHEDSEGGRWLQREHAMTTRVSLADMPLGNSGTVVAIQAGFGLTRHLDAMGLRPGVTLVKMAGVPFRGPIVVQTGRIQFALGYGVAMKILVELESSPQENAP
jgi:Fe2+ transport system protein FeoA